MKKSLLTLFALISFSQLQAQEVSSDSLDVKVFTYVDKPTEFPGGLNEFHKFISENIQYPEKAMKKGVQGKVFVKFIVERNGSITNAEVIKGISPEIDKEALRVIGIMPKWIPAELYKQKVRQEYTMPIQFKLNK